MLALLSLLAQTSPQNCTPGQAGINLQDCFALNDSQTVGQVYGTPAVLVNLLVRLAFIGAGIIFFFLLIIAGYSFITGGKKGADQAKTMLETALIGAFLMFAAYWILQIIGIVTGTKILI